jgi:hypothetical protein
VEPEPVVGYKIDWNAAKNGALQPPPGAIAPPDKWGFPARAVRMEFKVGSRYAKVTRPDGSVYTLDLGTPCVVAIPDIEYPKWKPLPSGTYMQIGTQSPESYKDSEFIKKYPGVYTRENVVIAPKGMLTRMEDIGFYVPFIPVAEAFGVPRENIAWDGQHLAVFGYYGDARNYRVLTPGTKETVCRVVGNNPKGASGSLAFPLFVKDGVPMVGINSVSDVAQMLFSVAGGSVPGLVNAYDDIYFGGWSYEDGTAGAACEPRV